MNTPKTSSKSNFKNRWKMWDPSATMLKHGCQNQMAEDDQSTTVPLDSMPTIS